jgi:tRNA dimethylallyltransferase
MSRKPHLIFVVGPTGVGKTELVVQAAERLGLEIINCDSVQVYRSVDIGTAKPNANQLARACHHLLSFVPEGETYTAGIFQRDVLDLFAKSKFQDPTKPVLVVGGSGFYVQALQKGMFELPETSDEVRTAVLADLEARGLSALYQEIQKRDPEYAEKISGNDKYRILRALEILLGQDKTITEIRAEFARKSIAEASFTYQTLGLQIDRLELRKRLEIRTMAMLEQGWMEEVQELRERGLGAWAPMQSVGYKQIQEFLDGDINLRDLNEQIITGSMQLAKRQMTWFRRDPLVEWFASSEAGFAAALTKIEQLADLTES